MKPVGENERWKKHVFQIFKDGSELIAKVTNINSAVFHMGFINMWALIHVQSNTELGRAFAYVVLFF